MTWLLIVTGIVGICLFCRVAYLSTCVYPDGGLFDWAFSTIFALLLWFSFIGLSSKLYEPASYSSLRSNVIYKSLDDFKYGEDNCKVLESQFGTKLILKIEQKDLPQSNYYRAVKSGDNFVLEPFSTQNETPFLEQVEPAKEGEGRPK